MVRKGSALIWRARRREHLSKCKFGLGTHGKGARISTTSNHVKSTCMHSFQSTCGLTGNMLLDASNANARFATGDVLGQRAVSKFHPAVGHELASSQQCKLCFGGLQSVPHPVSHTHDGTWTHMGDCQNYGPFLGPYYNTGPNTGPNLGDPKRDHNFDNLPHGRVHRLTPCHRIRHKPG